jgi:hypothetical protein
MQQPVGEGMSAFRIRRKLDFVDRKKLDQSIQWHAFDRTDEITCR